MRRISRAFRVKSSSEVLLSLLSENLLSMWAHPKIRENSLFFSSSVPLAEVP